MCGSCTRIIKVEIETRTTTKNTNFSENFCLHFCRYTKPISGIGIGAQKYNAEVKVSRKDLDASLVQLSDKLRHVRQVNCCQFNLINYSAHSHNDNNERCQCTSCKLYSFVRQNERKATLKIFIANV